MGLLSEHSRPNDGKENADDSGKKTMKERISPKNGKTDPVKKKQKQKESPVQNVHFQSSSFSEQFKKKYPIKVKTRPKSKSVINKIRSSNEYEPFRRRKITKSEPIKITPTKKKISAIIPEIIL
jgi:hypothetical protein